eukprot:6175456-Pleurochrysis_carterae.AAC.1
MPRAAPEMPLAARLAHLGRALRVSPSSSATGRSSSTSTRGGDGARRGLRRSVDPVDGAGGRVRMCLRTRMRVCLSEMGRKASAA